MMANIYTNRNLPRRIAVLRNKLKVSTSKLQRTASSVGFIEKCLASGYVPKFAQVRGQFIADGDRLHSEFNLKIDDVLLDEMHLF